MAMTQGEIDEAHIYAKVDAIIIFCSLVYLLRIVHNDHAFV